jgi:protein phosphatase-4 regulatory subunit 3
MQNKRRNSSGSITAISGNTRGLTKRKSFNGNPTSGGGKKIAISLSPSLKAGSGPGSNEES